MDQMNLEALGVPTLSDEHRKLIKKASKLTGYPEAEYTSKSEEEVKKIIDDIEAAKKAKEEAKKRIDMLMNNLKKEGAEYDESKSVEENQEELERIIDRKKNPKYKFPFNIYFKGHDIQEPSHLFNQDQEYTEKEIINIMFKAGYKEFSGKIKLAYDGDENMLIPEFESQRHG